MGRRLSKSLIFAKVVGQHMLLVFEIRKSVYRLIKSEWHQRIDGASIIQHRSNHRCGSFRLLQES